MSVAAEHFICLGILYRFENPFFGPFWNSLFLEESCDALRTKRTSRGGITAGLGAVASVQ
jgi:hypothetical protein